MVDLNVDAQGSLISNAKDRAAVWYNFLKSKFATTKLEQGRPSMAPLPARDPTNVLTIKEVRQAVTSLKRHKAVGEDGIPIEVYKLSQTAFNLL